MTHEQDQVSGTLMRGADGALYFIPDEALEPFRLPEEAAGPAGEILDQSGDVEGFASLYQPSVFQPLGAVRAIILQDSAGAMIIYGSLPAR